MYTGVSVFSQLQDVLDRELISQYEKPSQDHREAPREPQKPFLVTNGPWDRKPDMTSETEFPELGGAASPTKASHNVWGPKKR